MGEQEPTSLAYILYSFNYTIPLSLLSSGFLFPQSIIALVIPVGYVPHTWEPGLGTEGGLEFVDKKNFVNEVQPSRGTLQKEGINWG